MKITFDISDNIIGGFLNCIKYTDTGIMQMVSYHLGSDDFKDGNTVKLPRKQEEA